MHTGLLNKLKIIFVLIYLFSSVVLYFILDHYNYKTVQKLIQEELLMGSAIQKYVGEHQRPAIAKLINEGKLSSEYFDSALMSSTYIISHIQANFKASKMKGESNLYSHLDFKFASDNPTNPKNKANAFESKVLKKFNESDMEFYTEIVEHNGEKSLFYALKVQKNKQKCLQCHGEPDDAPKEMFATYGNNGFHEKVGEIRAINAVYAPLDSAGNTVQFYTILNLFTILIYTLIYFTLRYFFIQLSQKDELLAKQSRFAALGEMIRMIAHKWRQPLTAISMSVNNLLLDYELGMSEEKNSKETLEMMNKQVTYLSTTIDDFKNFFRPDIKSEKIHLAKHIKDSCMIIDSTLKSSGVELQIDIAEDIVLVTKKNDITQIVLNLLKNAMDAYKENAIKERVVLISATQLHKSVLLSVKDNAGGIPKEIIDKIFDPYFSTKDKKNGTGLGLYMSKMIVENHLMGELSVVTQGQSTTFTIKLMKEDT